MLVSARSVGIFSSVFSSFAMIFQRQDTNAKKPRWPRYIEEIIVRVEFETILSVCNIHMIKEPDKEVDLLARRVIGCAIEVHRTLGPGFLESLYEHALSRELALNQISHKCQHPVSISYKGFNVGDGRLDILIEDKLIIEIKSVGIILPVHFVQLRSYLKSTGLHLGLLINFNEARLADGIKRIIQSPQS